MSDQIDPVRAMNHLRMLSLALAEIMRIVKQTEGLPGCVALLVGENQGLARWLSPDSLLDPALAKMATKTRGDMSRICVIIMESDGARTGYLISTLVSWTEYTSGYAVFDELYIPPGTPLGLGPLPEPAPAPVHDDVFDTI